MHKTIIGDVVREIRDWYRESPVTSDLVSFAWDDESQNEWVALEWMPAFAQNALLSGQPLTKAQRAAVEAAAIYRSRY